MLVLAKRLSERGVSVALGGDITRHVRIVTEAPQEEFFGGALKQLAGSVKQVLARRSRRGWSGRSPST